MRMGGKFYVMDNASRCSRVLMPRCRWFEWKIWIQTASLHKLLYFYDSQVADDLKKRGYIVLFAKSGTRGTQLRPTWYIRPQ